MNSLKSIAFRLIKTIYVVFARGHLKKVFTPKTSVHFSHDLEFKYPENMQIGNNVRIGKSVSLGAYAGIIIGDDVTISEGVLIETAGLNLKSKDREHKGKAVHIQKGAWIGAKAIILGGVTIGENSVVGAGAIVRKDVAKNEVFVG